MTGPEHYRAAANLLAQVQVLWDELPRGDAWRDWEGLEVAQAFSVIGALSACAAAHATLAAVAAQAEVLLIPPGRGPREAWRTVLHAPPGPS